MNKKIRTRFAPSPTGALHIGGVRTALYNYLFAKQNNGEFILRIEDTDQKRYDYSAEQYIIDSFKWFGLEFDESPLNPNPKYGQYRQSERTCYNEYIKILLEKDMAYLAFDTSEELTNIRNEYKKMKKNFSYNYISRHNMTNSITLSKDEVQKRLDNNDPYVVRFKMPRDENIIITDLIRGKVKFNTNTLDDKVIMKADGTPTYHMANIVDDHLMEISHVIRGEEWLPSLPLHYLLYNALGWEIPKFAHLNLILNPDGKGKLSKRSAIKKGFSVFPLTAETSVDDTLHIMEGYKEKGYEPDSVLNFLALLGWSLPDNQEIITLVDMIDNFDMKRLSKAGARFNVDKLNWYNSKYINMLDTYEILDVTEMYDLDKSIMIANLCKERAVFRKDFSIIKNIFYNAISSYTDISKVTDDCLNFLNGINVNDIDFSKEETIKQYFYDLSVEKNVKFGKIMPGLRQAITGGISGPNLMSVIYILGKTETKDRIDSCVKAKL